MPLIGNSQLRIINSSIFTNGTYRTVFTNLLNYPGSYESGLGTTVYIDGQPRFDTVFNRLQIFGHSEWMFGTTLYVAMDAKCEET